MDHNPKFKYLSGGSAKKWTQIIDFVQIFLFSLFEYLGPLGAFSGHFRAPPVAYCMPKFPTWTRVLSCNNQDDQQPKKELLSNDCSFLGILGALNSYIQRQLCRSDPLLRPKVTLRSPQGLMILFSCISSATNQRKVLVCEFCSFLFSFSLIVTFLVLFLADFDPLLRSKVCPRSPYGP